VIELKPANQNLSAVTLKDIESHKLISKLERTQDLTKLRLFDASENRNTFYGNPTLYHYQFKNLLRCRREKRKTFYEVWDDPQERESLLNNTRKRNRGGRTGASNIWECFRANTGSIVMFKAGTAKYIYNKYNAKKVLDPTAGWGGRMLGAWALDIDYTGIDTNTTMKSAYDEMIDFLSQYNNKLSPDLFEIENSNLNMIWGNCLEQDFSKIDYDFVLTSTPYVNLELYEHMTPWDTNEQFYLEFFIPLWKKCCDHIKPGGTVAFNISPRMYDDACNLGLPNCQSEENLLQQLGQQKNTKKQDKIYMWHC